MRFKLCHIVFTKAVMVWSGCLFISFAVMYSVQKYYRRLMSSFSGMTQQQIVEMIYNSMFTDTPAYVTGIGMPMRQF